MLRFSFPPAFLFVCFLAQVPNYSGTYCQWKPNTLTPKSFRSYLRRLLRRGSRSNGPCALVNVFFFLSLLPSPRSHRETAELVEAVASRALSASRQTLDALTDLLLDNSTEEYIGKLTERWASRALRLVANAAPTIPPLRAAQLGAVIAFYRTAVYFKRNRASNCIKPPTSSSSVEASSSAAAV